MFVQIKMKLSKVSEKKVLITLLLLATIVLSLPYLIRILSKNNTLIGDIPYYHGRLSQTLVEQGIPAHDELSFGGRDYLFNPFHYIIASLTTFLNFNLIAKLLPFILGLLSVLMFYLILKKLDLDSEKIFLICAILILTPIFIYSFTVLDYHALVIFLLLLQFYFFMHKNKILALLSILILITVSFFNLFSAIIGILTLFCYSLTTKNLKKFYSVLFIVLVVCIIYYGQIYYAHGMPTFNLRENKIENFISDIGGETGFSIFSLILAFVGFFYISYKRKLPIIILITLIIAAFYFDNYLNLYLNFIIAFFAGNGFFSLLKRKWASPILRNFSIIVLICGIIFSPIAYIKELSVSKPNQSIADSLTWLGVNSNKKYVVFSSHDKGFWIEYFAKRAVVTDDLFTYAPQLNKRMEDSKKIFHSYKLEETKNLLDKYNIKYIWTDPEMKQDIWENKRTGLLFLFRNNETFKNVYNKDGIEIWEYLKKA